MAALPTLARLFGTKNRPLFILLILIPLSYLSSLLKSLADRFTRPHKSGHRARVLRVAAQLRRNRAARSGAASRVVRPARPGDESLSTRSARKDACLRVEMSDFRAVLHVHLGIGRAFVRVEPGATVGEVQDFLEGEGYMLENCVARRDVTIAGLVLGSGVGAHAHVAGMVHDVCVAYEMLTADGNIVKATATNDHAELFRAIPWSHGSLGLLVSVELKVIPCPGHVCVSYYPTASLEECHSLLEELATGDDIPWFLEAFVFSKDRAVVVAAELASWRDVSSGRLPVNSIGAWYKPWFHRHVQSFLDTVHPGSYTEEILPTQEYLMRHDRSKCLEMNVLCPEASNPWFRFLFGWMLPLSSNLLKRCRSMQDRELGVQEQVRQEYCLPSSRFKPLVAWLDEQLGIYPLHVYPCAIVDNGGFVRHRSNRGKPIPTRQESSFYMNVSVFGTPSAVREGMRPFRTLTRLREAGAMVTDSGGFMRSGTDMFQSEADFLKMLDHTLWRKMRSKYKATGIFPSVYDKVKPEVDFASFLKEEELWAH